MKNVQNKREKEVVYKRRFIQEILVLIDPEFLVILIVVFLMGFGGLYSLIEVAPIEVDIFFDGEVIGGRFGKQILEPIKEPEEEEIPEVKKIIITKTIDGVAKVASSRKSLGKEGKIGSKKSRVANAAGSGRRSLSEKVANSSGIMGTMRQGAAVFDKIFGGGGLGAGLEKNLGGVAGLKNVDQFGSGGLSVRGFGDGGGGNALAIGGLNTRGKGGGNKNGYGLASGKRMIKKRSDITADGARSVVMGALDRSVIDSYIRRNLAKIRWCYEKELAKKPTLFGKISIKFTISKSGSVSRSSVKRTTMGNLAVERCVARQIKRIKFPKPKGGGIVVVNYPFVFKNSDA